MLIHIRLVITQNFLCCLMEYRYNNEKSMLERSDSYALGAISAANHLALTGIHTLKQIVDNLVQIECCFLMIFRIRALRVLVSCQESSHARYRTVLVPVQYIRFHCRHLYRDSEKERQILSYFL